MEFSFRGGIHPPENKKTTEGKKFHNLAVPQICCIPMLQHIGAPAEPAVQMGDFVREGQLIGRAAGYVSANIHASVPGKIIEITEALPVYNNSRAVLIETEGSFSSNTGAKASWSSMSPQDILHKIREAGIVGLGGAAFPASVKLSPPENRKIEVIIVNGAECEPYLTVDDMLMQTFPDEIIEGVLIVLKVLGAEKAIIGIEDNKPQAISALKKSIASGDRGSIISVVKLRTRYPQGAEKQLIYSLLKREVPSGGLPMDAGAVVQNAGTIYSVYNAVVLDRPLYERYITVSGKMISKPGNYKVRIGTRISDLAEECGGLCGEPAKIVSGGPMCGTALTGLDYPVVKGTSGILFLSRGEINLEKPSACIRCGRCVSVCPMGLLPNEMGTLAEKGIYRPELNPYDCIMCGSCSYICPSRRPLSHYIKLTQNKLREKK